MAKKVSTKRRKEGDQEPMIGTIFEALAAHNPAPGADPKPEDKGPSVEDLLKQIAELKKNQEDLTRANTALMTQAMPVGQVTIPPEPKFSVDGLPDPVMDPAGYAKELANRQLKFNQEMTEWQNQKSRANGPAGNPEELWADFAIAYPELAEQEDRVEFTVSQVVKKAKARNIDLNRYMFGNREKFFADIASEYAKQWPGDDDEGDEGAEPTTEKRGKRKTAADDGDDEGRTEGIFGGQEQGGGRAPSGPKPGDMIKDLQDMQRKMGYF